MVAAADIAVSNEVVSGSWWGPGQGGRNPGSALAHGAGASGEKRWCEGVARGPGNVSMEPEPVGPRAERQEPGVRSGT